ncbi:Crp/Fnr family transcriptional regulator [Pararobbsia silviterrae]|uniref:Crp/Fnr family transcriptional regulator n=1 Tax=Pararobbsia silviterrae TaxID=1792498 RepID=A0A494X8V3_9BURK|nr:Crp/Fnr family transcriptional regulator [Pararobbsia silviterrae]RKP47137.1 Crp/Fnr family transcriptional regulator [Pararobbsia silviterrae]
MGHITKAQADQIMSERGWLPVLPEAFRRDVLRQATLLHFAPNEAVFRSNDPIGGVYGLVAGTLSVSIAPAGATPRLILLGRPGYWTGEGCFLTRQPRRGELRAVVDTTMLQLPLNVLDQMAARDPEVVRYVSLMLMMNVELLFSVIHDLQKPEADRRIASALQRMTWIGEVPIPLTQSDIGIMTNASRKQVNAAIKRFSEAGWLTSTYRSIHVVDPAALRHFAEGDGAD